MGRIFLLFFYYYIRNISSDSCAVVRAANIAKLRLYQKDYGVPCGGVFFISPHYYYGVLQL